jgi:hypothetical protein
MKIPTWLAWWLIRISMWIATIRIWRRGIPWSEARRLVAQEAKLYLHRDIHPQWSIPARRARAIEDGRKP